MKENLCRIGHHGCGLVRSRLLVTFRLPTGPAHPWKVCVVAHGRGQSVDPKSGPQEGGARRGHGSGDVFRREMLSSSDYGDGVLDRLSLLVLCASESICFRALS